MKKIVALVLCLVLALSLCTVAFGAGNEVKTVYDIYSKDGKLNYDSLKYYAATAPVVATANSVTPGNIAYYETTGTNAAKYVLVENSADATHYLVAAGTADDKVAAATKTYLKEVEAVAYSYVATDYTNLGASCGQLKDVVATNKYVTYTEQGATTATIKLLALTTTPAAGTNNVLYNGKLVVAADIPATATVVAHSWAASAWDAKTGVPTKYTCATCKTTGDVYAYDWQAPAGMKTDRVPGGFVAFVEGVTAGSTTTVESAKTFDAGIALYAGMALASVAGSAVVIGKKKEF